jgi:hypothetical protein
MSYYVDNNYNHPSSNIKDLSNYVDFTNLTDILNGNLNNESSKYDKNLKSIKNMELKEHQKTLLFKMLNLEQNNTNIKVNDDTYFNTNMGVLCELSPFSLLFNTSK